MLVEVAGLVGIKKREVAISMHGTVVEEYELECLVVTLPRQWCGTFGVVMAASDLM